MNTIKTYITMAGFLGLLLVSVTACEHEDKLTLNDFPLIGQKQEGSTMKEITVEGDNGVDRINSLAKAIEENGDGIYTLKGGSVYYFEGENTIKNNVIIKGEPDANGNLPTIQPIADQNGAVSNNMIKIEANVTLENVYVNAVDASTGIFPDRMFVVNAADKRIIARGCFFEYCKQVIFRLNSKGNKVYIYDSTIRNFAAPTSSDNGRLVDTRSNDQDSIVLDNNYIYNGTDLLVRFDNSCTNYFALTHNTVYNVGSYFKLNFPIELVVEDNIFANFGWKLYASPGVRWDVTFPANADDPRIKAAKATIRNNNFYFDKELDDLLANYPQFIKRTGYSEDAQTMIKEGRFVEENTFSEVLKFDYAPALPMQYLKLFYDGGGEKTSGEASGIPFFADEDGISGIVGGKTYSFNYQRSTASATASTTGGPIGAVRTEERER